MTPSFLSKGLPGLLPFPVSSTTNDDFESLFKEQTADYGVDLAKEFEQEQQYRIRMTQQLQQTQAERSTSDKAENQSRGEQASSMPYGLPPGAESKSSSGFFDQTNPYRISSTPTQNRNRMERVKLDPQQREEFSFFLCNPLVSLINGKGDSFSNGKNSDNLLLIMAATMTTYTNNPEKFSPSSILAFSFALLIAVCLLGVSSSVDAGTDDVARWIFGETSCTDDSFIIRSFLAAYDSFMEKDLSNVFSHKNAVDFTQNYCEEDLADLQFTASLFS